MTKAEATAPAKINLTLHVTGRRADGYHLLDSLVAFAGAGDHISVAPSDRLSLVIEGPEACGLMADDDNLVLRAARFLDPDRGAAIHLTKNLPVSSGIGGGSADAAATLTAMSAAAVMQGVEHCPRPPGRILVTGGGRKNPVLMRMLKVALDCPVEPVEAAGLDGDMLEAQAFAYLAVRVMRGLPTSCPSTTGVAAAVGGGQISRP